MVSTSQGFGLITGFIMVRWLVARLLIGRTIAGFPLPTGRL
jgi:hypothetical protein